MEDTVWLPALEEWTSRDGTTWLRGHPQWMTESDAARLQLRATTVVAVEALGSTDLTWLSPADRRIFWRTKVAGHLDVANGAQVPPNEDGHVFRATLWTDEGDRRLILISRLG